MIIERDTSNYNGNEVLNDAARRGDLATVQRLIVDEPDWNRWVATCNALGHGRWEVVDALLTAGIGELGRNDLLKHFVSAGDVDWTERMLRDGTSEKARGSALNRLAEWQRGSNEGRSAELTDAQHKCLLAVLAAGVAIGERRRAQKKARANGDDLLAAWLAD
ncbi:MAG: hypothetical protein ACRER5_16075 [Pseudomonas sp.]